MVSAGAEQSISKVVEQYSLKLNLDIATVNTSDDPGTADSLRHIAGKIKVQKWNILFSDIFRKFIMYDRGFSYLYIYENSWNFQINNLFN